MTDMTDSDDDDSRCSTTKSPRSLSYEIDDTERPSIAVVRAVAELTEEDVRDLDPLYDEIDPAYLDGIFESDDGAGCIRAEVSFEFNECCVTVTPGLVEVRRPE